MKVSASPKIGLNKPKKEKPPIEDFISWVPEGETISVPTRLLDYVVMFYGESGVGKTSTAAKIPGAYIIQCDSNRRGIAVRQTNIPNTFLEELNSSKPAYTPWEIVKETVNRCVEEDNVECVVVDNLANFYNAAFRHVCFKEMISHPNDQNDFGKTWSVIKDMMSSALNRVVESGKGLVVITHDTTSEVKLADGTEYVRVEPDVPRAVFAWIKEVTNFAFYFHQTAEGRVVQIRSDYMTWVKCGNDETIRRFYDPDGNPVNAISAGNGPGEAWKNIEDSFNNLIYDVKGKVEKKNKFKK